MSDFPARPKGAALEHQIEIEAPASRVWDVLADVGRWGDWNPVYPSARGSVGLGDKIALTISLPDMKPQKSTAQVYHSQPGSALQFGATAFAGLVHAGRYIEITPLSPERCRVVNGEAFGRILGPTLVRMVGAKIEDGLRRQNEGLKTAAEANR
jgi:hypothetical protein